MEVTDITTYKRFTTPLGDTCKMEFREGCNPICGHTAYIIWSLIPNDTKGNEIKWSIPFNHILELKLDPTNHKVVKGFTGSIFMPDEALQMLRDCGYDVAGLE